MTIKSGMVQRGNKMMSTKALGTMVVVIVITVWAIVHVSQVRELVGLPAPTA